MVKTRLSVVISKEMKQRPKLCTIVPLSTSVPFQQMPFHCSINPSFEIPKPWGNMLRWVKADMLFSASFERLDLLKLGKGPDGRRIYQTATLSPDDLRRVQRSVLHGLSMDHLTKHV